MAAAPPVVLAVPSLAISLGVLLAISLRKSPFDLATSHHAHQELVKGSTAEMSGPWLALAELGHWYEAAFVIVLILLGALQAPLLALAMVGLTYLVVVLVDNTLTEDLPPFFTTAAYDQGVVFCGNEGMRVFALEVKTGRRLWESGKLWGHSLDWYWPVSEVVVDRV